MKTNEERNTLENAAEAVNTKFTEVTDEELSQVSGGSYDESCFIYVIKKGDCLSVLAQRYGTTVPILVALNNIKNPNLIDEGNTLLIPYKG